ncbi:MAG TPA: anti-sigma factor [Pusillimonas sp.]
MTRNDHDILIAEYTLGLLGPQEIAQAHALLARDDAAAVQALSWEHHFLELTDLLAPVDPSPLLLARIQTSLGHDTTPAPSSLYRKPADHPTGKTLGTFSPPENVADISATAAARTANQAGVDVAPTAATTATAAAAVAPLATTPAKPAPRETQKKKRDTKPQAGGSIWVWRAASLVLAAIALALGLMPDQPQPPAVTIVEVAPTQAAILQAPGQSSTPGWTVTIDQQQNVLLNPQVRSDIPADASVQLWTHDSRLPQPRSLGLIDPNKPVTVPAALMGPVSPDQIFEMTLEPAGGSPNAAPTGPILFIGRIVTFGKRAATPQPAAGANTPVESS